MHELRTPLLAANWKMNQRWESCEQFASALRELLPEYFTEQSELALELLVCPPYPYLPLAGDLLGESALLLGAQDVCQYADGAFTSGVSAAMLADIGCDFCLAGHSERRQVFGDSDSVVGEKLKRLREAEVLPILCIGETLDIRQQGRALPHTLGQLDAVVEELQRLEPGGLIVAYEPVWAIGTGVNAEPQDAQEMAEAIRGWIVKHVGAAQAQGTLLLYGGSVKPENIGQYMQCADIDGALVGGASLKADSFAALAKAILALR
jgi:triosephosphate isomerase (TIM)